MEHKKQVLILYHSGAGSTKTIAEIFYKLLRKYSTDIVAINLDFEYKRLENYELLIFAFPTYHCSPSISMSEFIRNMPVYEVPKKAYALTTYGLYPGNTLREFSKMCQSRNINICGYTGYRSPATDGALLLSHITFMFNYEKRIINKLKTDIQLVEDIILDRVYRPSYPPFKLYSIFNYPNKVLGKRHKHRFSVLAEHCINCNKCISNCMRKCWSGQELPQHSVQNCEFCFRCVHHCPTSAIVLSTKTYKKSKLNESFYIKLKEKILEDLKEE